MITNIESDRWIWRGTSYSRKKSENKLQNTFESNKSLYITDTLPVVYYVTLYPFLSSCPIKGLSQLKKDKNAVVISRLSNKSDMHF